MASDAKPSNVEGTQDLIDEPITSIKIYTYPKIIFLWPTMVMGLLCGIGMIVVGDLLPEREIDKMRAQRTASTPSPAATPPAGNAPAQPPGSVIKAEVTPAPAGLDNYFTSLQNMLGIAFLLIFAANMVVLALDFPRFTIVAVFLVITTLTFLLLWLAPMVNILSPLVWLTQHIYAVANAGFYLTMSVVIALAYLAIWATRRLDYWEISPNEILHHHGPLSDLERFPTTQLKFSKEIPDILEYMLGLGSGRLTLSFGLDQRSVTLEQVLFINQKEEALKRMMSQVNVRMRVPGDLANG